MTAREQLEQENANYIPALTAEQNLRHLFLPLRWKLLRTFQTFSICMNFN